MFKPIAIYAFIFLLGIYKIILESSAFLQWEECMSPSQFGRSVGVYLAFVKIFLVKKYYHSMSFLLYSRIESYSPTG
jgi:hypothetical protein